MDSPAIQSAYPSTNDIGQLAPEILTNILGHLRFQEGRRAIRPCLLVSRYWSSIAYPLAWDSLSVNGDTLRAFIQWTKVDGASRMCDCVRSLSLRLDTFRTTNDENRALHSGTFVPFIKGLWDDVEELPAAVHAIGNLMSFSLRIDRPFSGVMPQGHSHDPRGARMGSRILGQILDALPVSCVDLELDTKALVQKEESPEYPAVGSDHLCIKLRNLLPRLRHVRLRMTVCPSFLRSGSEFVKAPRLLSLIINLNVGWTILHGVSECFMGMGNDSRAELTYDDGRKIQSLLSRELQLAHNAGNFPQARAILLMNLLDAPGVGTDHFQQHDIVQSITHFLPFKFVWVEDRTPTGIFVIRDRFDNERIASSMDAGETMLEDPCGLWFTTIEGDRWSADFRRSGCRRSAILLQPRLETRAQFLARHASDFPEITVDDSIWNAVKDCHAQTKQLNELQTWMAKERGAVA
ncbi:MAG: hypothetical protein Q9208_007394 [Pyrenodesmia sp. 3 TL-2023]